MAAISTALTQLGHGAQTMLRHHLTEVVGAVVVIGKHSGGRVGRVFRLWEGEDVPFVRTTSGLAL